MDLIDSKYLGILSSQLEKFKKVKKDLYNFRCPICGDSKKNKNKTRGYIYGVKNNINFKCHNCGSSMSFNNFMKELNQPLHKRYVLEKFKKGHAGKNFSTPEPEFNFERPKFRRKIVLPLCSEVEVARTYLQNRRLDPEKFYWAEDFSKFVRSFKELHDKNLRQEPRIVIPLYYEKDLVGFQGRSMNSRSVKYITLMLGDNLPKIYGLDTIEKDSTVYVTEGPFDSTFIRNAIAMCGADADVDRWGISNPVYIYDNEPRNREIVSRIQRTINNGGRVVIWPSQINEKDLNDMALAGHDVQNLVESNTYCNLQAQLKFNTWKRI